LDVAEREMSEGKKGFQRGGQGGCRAVFGCKEVWPAMSRRQKGGQLGIATYHLPTTDSQWPVVVVRSLLYRLTCHVVKQCSELNDRHVWPRF
jgi:hypothetical protein